MKPRERRRALLPIFFNMRFKVCGVPVCVTWHFLALITFMLSLHTENVLYAVVFSLLHETGHIAAMTALGNAPLSVSLELTGINIGRRQETGISLIREIIIALAGPFANLILFVFLMLIYLQNGSVKCFNASCVNLILMTFNLLPVKGLDGGKVLYYFVSKFFSFKTANIILRCSSAVFILFMLLYGGYLLYITRSNFTMLIIALMLTLTMFSKEEC